MLLRLFIVIRIFISLYTYNIVMVCGISCAIAFIFIVANVYCCVFSHRSGGVIQEFVSKLSPENQKRYALITRERQGIYFMGLFLGFILSIFILVIISASASHEFTWKSTVLNGVFLVTFTYLAFVQGLNLQFPLFPTFFD